MPYLVADYIAYALLIEGHPIAYTPLQESKKSLVMHKQHLYI